jgi:branched-chain amino acid transport system substrate-binding protein
VRKSAVLKEAAPTFLEVSAMRTPLSRRAVLAAASAAAASALLPRRAVAAPASKAAKIKIGLLLPYSGTYASLGNNITAAMKLAATEHGGRLGGREIEWVAVDDESDPAKAPANVNKLVVGEKVDILTGPVHSGVAMAMMQIVRQEKTLTVVTNAGAQAVTGRAARRTSSAPPSRIGRLPSPARA